MKYIVKNNNEPTILTRYRSTPGADYNKSKPPTDVKDEIRKSLIQEQGYICCYCMKRITLSYGTTKIEHFKPRKIYNGSNGKPNLKLSYDNMLLACTGMELDEQGNNIFCCDTKKDDSELFYVNPLNENIENVFYYTKDGEIKSHNENIQNEIDNVLNLNNQKLKEYRKKKYSYAKQIIEKAEEQKKCSLGFLNDMRKKWYEVDSDGMFKEFCMVVVYLIDKKIKKIKKINEIKHKRNN